MSQERDTDVCQVFLYMYVCISLTLYIFLMGLGPPYCPFKGDPHLYGAFRVCVCVCVYALWLFSSFLPASFVRAALTLTMKSFFSTSAASASSGRAEQPACFTSEEHDVGVSAAQLALQLRSIVDVQRWLATEHCSASSAEVQRVLRSSEDSEFCSEN